MAQWQLHRVAARIDRIAYDCNDGRVLRVALLEEISRHVAFDAFAWLLTDPETEVGSDPLADVPWLPELPKLIRLKYSTEVNRWTHLTAPSAGSRPTLAGIPNGASCGGSCCRTT